MSFTGIIAKLVDGFNACLAFFGVLWDYVKVFVVSLPGMIITIVGVTITIGWAVLGLIVWGITGLLSLFSELSFSAVPAMGEGYASWEDVIRNSVITSVIGVPELVIAISLLFGLGFAAMAFRLIKGFIPTMSS